MSNYNYIRIGYYISFTIVLVGFKIKVCVRACVRECMRACVRACVRAFVHPLVHSCLCVASYAGVYNFLLMV